jgi:ribose 5-phosphate isomerase B
MSGRRFISEREIRRAVREGLTSLDVASAVLSPSAIDAARTLGITLTGMRGADRSTRTTGKPFEDTPGGDAARAALTSVKPGSASPAPAIQPKFRISVGADHGGVNLKNAIAARLGHSVDDRGTMTPDAVDYPDYAARVANDVAAGMADLGIVVDGAGIGSCMAANKVAGVRAAMCYDVTTARNAREHNHANVLTLGAGMTGTRLAMEIVEMFLATPFGTGRHAARVAKIDALDKK